MMARRLLGLVWASCGASARREGAVESTGRPASSPGTGEAPPRVRAGVGANYFWVRSRERAPRRFPPCRRPRTARRLMDDVRSTGACARCHIDPIGLSPAHSGGLCGVRARGGDGDQPAIPHAMAHTGVVIYHIHKKSLYFTPTPAGPRARAARAARSRQTVPARRAAPARPPAGRRRLARVRGRDRDRVVPSPGDGGRDLDRSARPRAPPPAAPHADRPGRSGTPNSRRPSAPWHRPPPGAGTQHGGHGRPRPRDERSDRRRPPNLPSPSQPLTTPRHCGRITRVPCRPPRRRARGARRRRRCRRARRPHRAAHRAALAALADRDRLAVDGSIRSSSSAVR